MLRPVHTFHFIAGLQPPFGWNDVAFIVGDPFKITQENCGLSQRIALRRLPARFSRLKKKKVAKAAVRACNFHRSFFPFSSEEKYRRDEKESQF